MWVRSSRYFPAEALFVVVAVAVAVAVPVPALPLPAGFVADASFPISRAPNTLLISSRMMSRPLYLPRPVTQSNPPSRIMAGGESVLLFASFLTLHRQFTKIPRRRRRGWRDKKVVP